ncbi:conserved hypothetical protein [Thiomonas arsenitoxydans]|uniref:Uncharacterized protein n=1 Tax=Thiomonas arsenitoxydans (strain DSM 22701 / CIP 110005 / 3As) TaxID=426114 RepID=D6CVT5_THIA3|nr:hypothetical protein THI_p0028 [Thiomonas arsenitoxydans]CQR32709.1 conserved hypothetical protein [Thiomonas arsenitoxydans]
MRSGVGWMGNAGVQSSGMGGSKKQIHPQAMEPATPHPRGQAAGQLRSVGRASALPGQGQPVRAGLWGKPCG